MTKEKQSLFSTIPENYKKFFWICWVIMAFVFGFSLSAFIVKPTTTAETDFPKFQILSEGKGYAFSFDVNTKNPAWAMEILRKDNAKPKTHSSKKSGKDTNTSAELSPKIEDYVGSGFDPVLLFMSPELKSLLPASSPQPPMLAKYWAQLDDYVINLPQKLDVDRILVITEPLYLPQETSKTVVYDLIGEDNIAVPTHFFRAIFYSSQSQISILEMEKHNAFSMPSPTVPIPSRPFPPLTKLYGEAFLIPNQAIQEGADLDSFRVQSWEEIEKIPGVVLPDNLTFFTQDWQ